MKTLLIILFGFISISSASAINTNTSFTITGTLNSSCTIGDSGDVNFNNLSIQNTGNTDVNVNCRTGTNYMISVSSLNGWELKNDLSADTIPYTLSYTGGASGVNNTWSGAPNGTTAVTTSPQIGNGTVQSFPLEIKNSAANASMSNGQYQDIVIVSINYT